ncbi:putative transcriptional regulator with HTH domain [Rhodobacteraceae bacterium HIMB11]|nr:putative transcriptional regulator with HTH domain [Rhodobacteraceae bacterium HIMB11]
MSAHTKQLFKCENGHTFQTTPHRMRHGAKCPICLQEMHKDKDLVFEGRTFKNVKELSSFTGVPAHYIAVWMRNGLSAEAAINNFYSKTEDKRKTKSWESWKDLRDREDRLKELQWDTKSNSLSEWVQTFKKSSSRSDWSKEAIEIIKGKAAEGVIIDSIALQLKKSPDEVILKMQELGVFEEHARAHPAYLQTLADEAAGRTGKAHGDISVTDPKVVSRLVFGDETKTVEFKQTFSRCLNGKKSDAPHVIHAVLKTIAAFANTKGGQLLIGVQDKPRNITGLELDDYKNDRDDYTKGIMNRVKTFLGTLAATLVDIEIIRMENGKEICLIKVDPSTEPVFCTHSEFEKSHKKYISNPELLYIRQSGETHKLKPSEMLIYCKNNFS